MPSWSDARVVADRSKRAVKGSGLHRINFKKLSGKPAARRKNADPSEIARLRQQTRNELQRVLSPLQLEEFLLRYSQNANDLRADLGSLRFFNANSNEFRAMFRACDALDQQIQLLSTSDPNQAAQRKALEDQRENALRITLGDQRYEQYTKLHDPAFRDAVAIAEKAGSVRPVIYEISLATADDRRGSLPTRTSPLHSAASNLNAWSQTAQASASPARNSPGTSTPPLPQRSSSWALVLRCLPRYAVKIPVSALRATN